MKRHLAELAGTFLLELVGCGRGLGDKLDVVSRVMPEFCRGLEPHLRPSNDV